MQENHGNNKVILSRIFVVGCPRSGTTLTQSLLAAHTRVASFPESHFFSHLFVQTQNLLAAYPRIASFPGSHFFFHLFVHRCIRPLRIASSNVVPRLYQFLEDLGRGDMKPFIPEKAWLVGPYVKAYKTICDQLTTEQNKGVWLEKTPGHLHYLKYIQKLIKDSKFVHVIRNGPDVVASLYEVTHKHPEEWGGARDIECCLRRWIQDVRISLQNTHRPHHLIVRYEHLVADPASVLRDLCRFIGVAYSDDLLQEYAHTSKSLITKGEPWKASVGKAIRSYNGDKFFSIFDSKQQQYVLDRLKDAGLHELSYPESKRSP
jgi:hypothetical protein